jgi:hypothetical protein
MLGICAKKGTPTLSIMTLSITVFKCRHVECRVFIVILGALIMSAIMLIVSVLSVVVP